MPVDRSLSPAVQLAWKIAAAVAQPTAINIETSHFLYGIFSLDTVPAGQIPETWNLVQEELPDIGHALKAAGVTFHELRRNLRANAFPEEDTKFAMTSSRRGKMSRSEAVRQAFGRAASSPDSRGAARVGLLDLTRELLDGEPVAATWLGLGPRAYHSLMSALGVGGGAASPSKPEVPDIAISIFRSLDAQTVADGVVDWARIGEHFGQLCELAWEAGVSTRVEPLLDSSVEILLKAIPAAEHAAVLLLDDFGELLLKSHAPRGALTVSTSSAMKAIHQRNSFIWQRNEDLTQSQLENNLRAGLYAPILASGEVFGVICMDAQSAASLFTHDDLYLATSLGHQLGLTMANRRREEDLYRTAQSMERLLTNFSPQVRDRLLAQSESGRIQLGGERSVISILRANIHGFSRASAEMEAEPAVTMLNEYLGVMVAVIFKYGGTVDKFSGDSLMAIFGSPEVDAMHPEKITRAAVELQAEVGRVSERRATALQSVCTVGVGAHTGEAIHGFIGSLDRMDYAVIGPAVDLAVHLCNSAQPGDVILSQELFERVWKDAMVESVQVPIGAAEPLAAFRLLKMRAPRQIST